VRRRAERGAATILVLAMAGLVVFVTTALAVVVGLVAGHRTAQSAADLAALAGARSLAQGADGCAEAAGVARANRAHLVACAVTGRVLDVRVTVRGSLWLDQVVELTGEARAGPAP
jgi:secretion/DNA translocation related TadE-like protein